MTAPDEEYRYCWRCCTVVGQMTFVERPSGTFLAFEPFPNCAIPANRYLCVGCERLTTERKDEVES